MKTISRWTALALVLSLTLLWAGQAGATTPTQGSIVPDSAVPVGPQSTGQLDSGWIPDTPFSSGQAINVVVPANSVLPVNTDLQVLECSAPNGVIPTQSSACDPKTLQAGTVTPNPDGSVNLLTEPGGTGYTVYNLPDDLSLGENNIGPKCGDTVATECIIYIGDDYNDLTQPNVWSQPFYVSSQLADDDSGQPGGDGSLGTPPPETPEATSIVALPAIAVGLVGLAWLQMSRRRRRSSVMAQQL